VLSIIFGPKTAEVTRGWRKLHNEELHNLYSSPSIITMIKARGMRWVGHVARMGRRRRRRMHVGYWWEIQNERDHWENQDHWEDQDLGGWKILKCILGG
jgi:hypothetical protein